jgi:ABC-type multidrug transport system fused ATPase/permease subunit
MKLFNIVISLLTLNQKRGAIYQCFLMIISIFFELVGIGLLIPMMALISDDNLRNQPILNSIFQFLEQPTKSELLIYVMGLFVLIYFIKLIFMSYVTWANYKFVFSLQTYFSAKLFKGYLFQPLSFHTSRNSAQLIQNSINIVATTTGVLINVLLIVTESITAIAISILLIYLQPKSVLFILMVFTPAILGFHMLTKKKLLRLGELFQKNEGRRIQYLQQGLGAIKDIKILGREIYFFNKYQLENSSSANAQRNQQTLQAIPRHYLEFLAMFSIGLLVIYLSIENYDFSYILTTVGLFGGAAFRLMPSLNRISGSAQYIRFSSPILFTLKKEIELIDNKTETIKDSIIVFSKKIQVKNVTFTFDGSPNPIFDNIDLTIFKGQSIGIIGTTGEGKSTLIDIILGLLNPTQGEVLVDEVSIQCNLKSWQSLIGYVPQNIYLTDDSIRNNIAFGIEEDLIDDNLLMNAIKLAQIEELILEQPEGLFTIVGERGVRLSGGEKQRIGIARALYNNPSIIVLDEATSSLDVKTEADVMKSVELLSEIKTVIIVAHRLSTVQNCDKIYKLKSSKLIDITQDFKN